MTARAFIVMAALAGCGQPKPLHCNDDSPCLDGVCIDSYCAVQDVTCASGYRYDQSAGDYADECTMSGHGGGWGSGNGGDTITETVYALTTDGAANPVPASTATDDVDPTCAHPDGRDVMYELTLPARQRVYLDTFASTYNVVLAVYSGACKSSAKSQIACVSSGPGACDAQTMQWSGDLNAGTYCIVVDQPAIASPQLASVRALVGQPDIPTARVGSNLVDTCADDAWPSGCYVGNAEDATWFFMACGNTSWSVSAPMTWTGDLEARTLRNEVLDCYAGADIITFNLAMPGPVWLIAHTDPARVCGTINVQVTQL